MSTYVKTVVFGGALWLSLGGCLVAPAFADHDDHDKIEALVKAGNFISPDQAREAALAAKPGTVTDLDLERGWRASYYYEVEIVDSELREWEVQIDAKTGTVQGIERDLFD